MKEKFLKEDISWEDLNSNQTEIAEAAIDNPELTHKEIAELTDWSRSYVSTVHQDYLEERIIADEVGTDDVTDDLYEIIVAGMEAMEEVERVERHHDLDLNRGNSKEVDVAVWISQGGHDFLVIIECKLHGEAVKQDIPAAMAWYQENSAANKAMIISSNGFQSGAITLARDAEVELYRLDELTRDVGEGHMMQFDISIEIRPQQAEVLDLQLEPVEGEDYDEDSKEINVTGRDELFDENRNPVGKTLQERAQEAVLDKSQGTYTEEVEHRLLLLDGDFYRLTGIEYQVRRLDPAEFGFEIDTYEEYDLYMRDVLEDEEQDLDLVSIEEAIRTFEEEVR